MIKASALRVVKDADTNGCFSTNSLAWLVRHNQNIVIESEREENHIPDSVEKLAQMMFDNDEIIKDVLNEIRMLYVSKRDEFRISLKGKSREAQERIVAILQNMYGIISALYFVPEAEMLCGKLVFSSKAQMFITGRYLEIAVYKRVQEIISILSIKHNKAYKIYRNVHVTTREGKQRNEFDLVIEFDGIFYVVEIKSGKNFREFDKYMTIGREYEIVPDRFLLVANYLTDEHAKTIEYFCEYYVANLKENSLENKLTQMIENDQKGGN